MGNKEREALALRVISVSGQSAIRKAQTPDEATAITDRTDSLLADLESLVIRDGGDEQILTAIDRERRRLHE